MWNNLKFLLFLLLFPSESIESKFKTPKNFLNFPFFLFLKDETLSYLITDQLSSKEIYIERIFLAYHRTSFKFHQFVPIILFIAEKKIPYVISLIQDSSLQLVVTPLYIL